MNKGYNVNTRKLSHRRRNRWMGLTVLMAILIAAAAVLAVYHFAHPNTKIKNTKSVTTVISSLGSSSLTTYKASDFSFQMSPGWSLVPNSSNNLYTIYEWQTGQGENYETVQVFEDTIPSNFAVNHAIVVSASGNKLSVLGAPSDNCDTFTNGHTTNTQVGYPAKWQGAAFNCDLDNTERDTVGTTSTTTVNSVSLVSPTNAHHSFFFLYTDHALQPNYGDFEQLLNSFQLQ
jgi:hypothetical protein